MPVFRKAVDRLASLLRGDRRITYRAHIHPRVAPYVTPLFNRIVADDEDGETYRAALIDWRRAERPPLALYHGESSFCRIDGPRQWVRSHFFPLGGLILSPGVTAHLDPFEAGELHDHMKSAIEEAIRKWIADHDLHNPSPIPAEIDRSKADRAAKAMITDWAARHERDCPVADNDAEGPDHA